MELIIESVSKKYKGDFYGLRDLSLEIKTGVLGLLGPNGAGKSTLMRILSTITRPTGGKVSWNGIDITKDPNAVRRILGYLPQDFGVYPHLNAVEFLEYLAAIRGLDYKIARKRIDELLHLVNLHEVRKKPLNGFSGGMRQRVGIAQALLNDPKLLIVDEPTVGLDPEERIRFRNLLSELSGERIVILSTHIVSDIEATATDIAIVNQGRNVIQAAPSELLAATAGKVWEWLIPSHTWMEVRKQLLVSSTIQSSEGVRVRVIADTQPSAESRVVLPTLEDAYLYYISANKQGATA
ncbi:ABC-type multidrug transport system, ATPase component [Paenibacillus algorifonticola]|uniref:ABC-type multidrug transport system, ATPase component n=1 Tax=Paenibacillus algorifonticola TaxID=684063 RepID=A0A1I2DN54_9BACL|nr:ABC transporter ATP-binding protein [Paenibacillus algorifonticola]SFE81829.1 ABC-type multidrug transport system, ATPase component [Paenibacillus algorifonticola]